MASASAKSNLSGTLPDFVKWAEAMGCVGIRVDDPQEVEAAIDKANSINDRPVVVDFRVAEDEKVFPMVPLARAMTTFCCTTRKIPAGSF
jgi:Thiamine pyrophosphate-requiring enzymes [acetolactate synthase, pyruvate dehydrogenase (cytochrome), glyoxylate carboligase, phosphonopyruvate decarboxylase]